MKLLEALEILKRAPTEKSSAFELFLVSGFTPLHFQTFLVAELLSKNVHQAVSVLTGLYGDVRGNLELMARSNSAAAAIVLEWGDFDGRLGTRNLGSWDPGATDEILKNTEEFGEFLSGLLKSMPVKMPVSLSSPSLPLLPISHAPSWQASRFELLLRQCLAVFLAQVSTLDNVYIVPDERLAISSPLAKRLDLKSEYSTGFPYQLAHASELAKFHANQLLRPHPKKGLITDLDDTLWRGILGEVGVDSIAWDLEHGAHGHGSYQRFLQSLSYTGVLLAAASKNDSENVRLALQRSDLLISPAALYPVEANWKPKSESITRILKTWNISADSVVFIDDSPMELAEVKEVHPGIECILFPKTDPSAILELQYRLRDLFGKRLLTGEDAIRQESIRAGEQIRNVKSQGNFASQDFLKNSNAELTLDLRKEPLDPRALELINKTNQFNLNGRRFSDVEWLNYIQDGRCVLLLASYRDKYGPLGKISVLAGRRSGRSLVVDVWVLSCRAFSRKIEHRILQELFTRFDLEEIVLRFIATPKNGPLQEFLRSISGGPVEGAARLTRIHLDSGNFATHHNVLEFTHG
jgi:FkbH-like protein